MIFISILFAFLAVLALYGQFRYGINYSPFYFKQNTIYFVFEFLLCSITSLGFYLAAKEEAREEDEEKELG
jgi:hypothetical protein